MEKYLNPACSPKERAEDLFTQVKNLGRVRVVVE